MIRFWKLSERVVINSRPGLRCTEITLKAALVENKRSSYSYISNKYLIILQIITALIDQISRQIYTTMIKSTKNLGGIIKLTVNLDA